MSMSAETFAIYRIITPLQAGIPHRESYWIEEKPEYTEIHQISRESDFVIPTAIAVRVTSDTPNPFYYSTDSLILIVGRHIVAEYPLSLLFLESGRTTFVADTGKYYLHFDLTKWFHEIPLIASAFHETQVSLRSGTPFFLQTRRSHLDTVARRSLAERGIRYTFQSPSTYSLTPDLLESSEFQVSPAFTGLTKGYILEADINQLRSARIDFKNRGSDNFYTWVLGPDQLATQCHRLSDNYLWIPFNPIQTTPFSREPSSFVGSFHQTDFHITFHFNFEEVQQQVRIHSIQYNLMCYRSGMGERENEIEHYVLKSSM